MATETIKTREQFIGLLREAFPEMLRQDPNILFEALGNDREKLSETLRKLGFLVSAEALDPKAVVEANREALDDGRILSGFGATIRERCQQFARTYRDPVTGRERVSYLWGENRELAAAWFRAFFSADKRDPVTERFLRDIARELNQKVRAPATPLTADTGTGGWNLVPTLVAAQIFEEKTERFVLRGLVQSFTSASPLRIPRRTSLVTVTTGMSGTDLSEVDTGATLGSVLLSPNRVGALAYIAPDVAMAASVGPVQYFINQFALALAKWAQDKIVAGNEGDREPRGITTLPTSGGNTFDLAKTATWDNTSKATRRKSFKKLYYAIGQEHREADVFVWITNNDGVQAMHDTNDLDEKLFEEAPPGGFPTYLRRRVVETSAIATSGGQTTVLAGDMSQYAWLESPAGLELETTREGGKAWESHTIGVKVVEHVDGAPIIPPAFGKMTGVNV
jgi:HK97 family phage major capsid protein